MSKLKASVRDISKTATPRDSRLAYLGEDYDGISQYVLIRLSRGSTSSGLALVPGSSYRIPQAAGTPVSVISVNGVFQLVSMGHG
jgi:hypothetical protein